MRPVICISTYFINQTEFGDNRVRGLPGQDMVMASMDYARAISNAGGLPVILAHILKEDYYDEILEACDGVLFAGGSDLNPLLYQESPEEKCMKVNTVRDEFELKLLTRALEKDIPVLGICRGMQLINVHYGGSLYQDQDEAPEKRLNHAVLSLPKWHQAHEVKLMKNSMVKELYKKEKIWTNSFHHQLVKETGPGLHITARASDGTIEALEDKSKYFMMGVQWHPEMMFQEEEEQKKIFKFFVDRIKAKN